MGREEEEGMGRFRSPGSNVMACRFYSKYNGNMGKNLTLHRGLEFSSSFFVFVSSPLSPSSPSSCSPF